MSWVRVGLSGVAWVGAFSYLTVDSLTLQSGRGRKGILLQSSKG